MDHCSNSFSAVNMCRFVILAVIAALLVSCVLADSSPNLTTTTEGPTPTTPASNATTKCGNTPEMKEHRVQLENCFNSTVQYHLDSNATLKDENCTSVAVFSERLDAYFTKLYTSCNISLSFNTTDFIKLIEFSLSNNSFNTFYENITACVKNVEHNISNNCVKDKLGFFNITMEEKHLKWFLKGQLKYNPNTCWNSKGVRDCSTVELQKCPHTTTDYVKSLFEYARGLGRCDQFPDPSPVPSPNGNGTAEASTWLTTPVAATLGVAGVVVVGAIITVIIIKNK